MMAPSPHRGRKLVKYLLLLVGIFIAAQALRLRVAEKAVRDGNGQLSHSLRPQNGWGDALHAEALLDSGKAAEAIQASRVAIAQTPYAAGALRTMAQSLERIQGPRAAEPVWQVASALGWRDKPTQLWAMLRALSNGEAGIFAMRADALLRAPGDRAAMTSLVRQAMLAPAVRQAFAARLAQRPPWRPPFFDVDRPLQGRELQGTVAALLSLAGTGAEPSRRELYDAESGLLMDGSYDAALALDRKFVPRTPDPGSLIDDGGFELADTDYVRDVTPFDWKITEPTAALDRSNERRSMGVTTEGSRGLPALVRYVRLEPGSYQFRFQTKGDIPSPSMIGFSVICANSGASLGESDRSPLAGGNWQARSFSFQAPSSCPLLKIQLTPVQSDAAADALFDDIAIVRN